MFFENLQKMCKMKNTTPTTVCKACGISTSQPTAWKHGTNPRSDIVIKISEFLQVPVSSLLGDENTSVPNSNDFSPLNTFTPEEITLIHAWRSHPEYHDALRKMLDMTPTETKIDTTYY